VRAESTVKPPQAKFLVEQTSDDKCNVHMYENVKQVTNEEGEKLYEYDVYVLEGIPYHDRLSANIAAAKSAWLERAKSKEDEPPQYTPLQLAEQNITDLQIENIEQGQMITDHELMILEGVN